MKKYLFLLMVSGLLIGCSNLYPEEGKSDYVLEEIQYNRFELENLTQYGDSGIINVEVAPYSKGIDILLTTDKEDFSKEDFDVISQDIVKKFKNNYGFESDLEVGVVLYYQPDPNEDAKMLFETTIK